MSGTRARIGFRFQDAFLLSRVLEELRLVLTEAWNSPGELGIELSQTLTQRFGIEAKPRAESESRLTEHVLDWDVTVQLADRHEWIEVKSGSVSKEDRRVLWRRMRETLGAMSNEATRFAPALAADPAELDDLSRWQALAPEAAAFTGAPPASEPAMVLTPSALLAEALWWLCAAPHDKAGSPPLTLENALRALQRFQLFLYQQDDLSAQVAASVEALFPGGPTEAFCGQLHDWVNRRAMSGDSRQHYFTPREMLADLRMLERALAVDPASLKRWRAHWDTWPRLLTDRTHAQIGERGVSLPIEATQPAAADMLTHAEAPVIIVARAGLGKSTLLSQLANARELASDIALRFGAVDVDCENWDDLEESLRFRASLAALESVPKRVWLFVDGVDEVEESELARFVALLGRLGQIPHLRVIASVRDGVWRDHPAWREVLAGWRIIGLEPWSEETVRGVLTTGGFTHQVSGNLLDLLRTPILLDLFWRTFVESGVAADTAHLAQIQTRHAIVEAFWKRRLLDGPRRGSLSRAEVEAGLHAVGARCAESLGSFEEAPLPAAPVSFLVYESVLVREQRLHARLRFRHPLLRDFALAQLCLSGGSAVEAVRQWSGIRSSLQREGGLRALLEAIADAHAGEDYPTFALVDFLSMVRDQGAGKMDGFARTLGILKPVDALDPAIWPAAIGSGLPPRFASDLIHSAQNHSNPGWAMRLALWPLEAAWIDDELPERVMHYGEVMLDRYRDTKAQEFRDAAVVAAERLRQWSRHARFRARFEENEAWLLASVIRVVARIDQCGATLGWVEKALDSPTWRVRHAVLEVVPNLASVDAPRAAKIFRRAAGMSPAGAGLPMLDGAVFTPLKNSALDKRIIGADPRSCLCRFTDPFLPLALDLAVALRRLHEEETREEREERERRFAKHFGEEVCTRPQPGPSDLIDDSPNLTLWQNGFRTEPHEHVLAQLQEAGSHIFITDRGAFFALWMPLMRACPLATVQSILLDLAVTQHTDSLSESLLGEMLCDLRLYAIRDLWPWLEHGLELVWLGASPELRSAILNVIPQTASLPGGEYLYRQLLCRLPAEAITAEQQAMVDAHLAAGNGDRDRHQSFAVRSEGPWEELDVMEEWERWGGEWPVETNPELLKDFYKAGAALLPDASAEDIAVALGNAVALGEQVLAEVSAVSISRHPRNPWVLRHLTAIFRENLRRARQTQTTAQALPELLVRGCADLATSLLDPVPTELAGHEPQDGVYSPPGVVWIAALDLLQGALAYPPLAGDTAAQEAFERVLTNGFQQGGPATQQAICLLVDPWHWLRSPHRRAIFDRLFWQEATHGVVVKWSLKRLDNYSLAHREACCRRLLSRADFVSPKPLFKELGHMIGLYGLALIDEERTPIAALVDEVVEGPSSFPLFNDQDLRRKFLHWLLHGLSDAAKQFCPQTVLAPDYGRWALAIWRQLTALPPTSSLPHGALLSAMHWLDRHSEKETKGSVALAHWWRAIFPLLLAATQEGAQLDADEVFRQLREDGYATVMPVEDLLTLSEALCKRLSEVSEATPAKLADGGRHRQRWQQTADYAAHGLDAAHRSGRLSAPVQLERAYGALMALAHGPVPSRAAATVLQRIQQAES